jgi:hypothetical protein
VIDVLEARMKSGELKADDLKEIGQLLTDARERLKESATVIAHGEALIADSPKLPSDEELAERRNRLIRLKGELQRVRQNTQWTTELMFLHAAGADIDRPPVIDDASDQ